MSEENIIDQMTDAIDSEFNELRAEILRLRAENEKLRDENINLFARLDKAHSFISRADWLQFFEEEREPAAAWKETDNGTV